MISGDEQEERIIGSVDDPVARGTLRMVFHFRRYLLLYVVGIIGALILILLPTVEGGSGLPSAQVGSTVASGTGPGAAGQGGGAASVSGSGAPTGSPGAGTPGASALGSGAAAPGGSTGGAGAGGTNGGAAGTGPVGAVSVGTGRTAGGFACSAGVPQIPWATYAAPCVGKFTGNNGGATAPGVTGSTITIAVRVATDAQGANALEGQAEAEAAGGVDDKTNWQYLQTLTNYFNKTFDLYGRKVVFTQYNGQGNGTNEALGQDEVAACADADQAATSVHAFGLGDYNGFLTSSEPLADCAARYHLYMPEGADYFPESYYQQWNPYIWSLAMNCTTINDGVEDYVANQLYPYPTKWAGMDGLTNLNGKPRKFAVYVPNNAGYQSCTNYGRQLGEQKYHESANRYDQYNYALDISTFPQDAQNAMVKFAANQDTTIVLACDPLSPIFMTQDATKENYFPEWMLIGVALTDSDNLAQLWDQQAISGHLFGLSQGGDEAAALSPTGEIAKTWEAASGQSSLANPEIYLDYIWLMAMFDQLQAAGPDLTIQSLAAGTRKLPVLGGPHPVAGTWNWQTLHTAIVDSRQVYWDANRKSIADNKQGTYVQIYNGQRFQAGQYPTGQPPYYP
jgi:hypothetical protein